MYYHYHYLYHNNDALPLLPSSDLFLYETYIIHCVLPHYLASLSLSLSLCDTAGFAVYPDGHPNIPSDTLFQAALAKQALLAANGVQGNATTQICFNPVQTMTWVEGARKAGFNTPIKLGLPGSISNFIHEKAFPCQKNIFCIYSLPLYIPPTLFFKTFPIHI